MALVMDSAERGSDHTQPLATSAASGKTPSLSEGWDLGPDGLL